MTTDNIIPMPTSLSALADRYRAAYRRIEQNRGEWIADTLVMAEVLHEARERFPNDIEFSVWIVQNGLDFHNKDDRAALINMQRNRTISEIVLEETARTSPQLIWREEIMPRLLSAKKPLPFESSPPESTTTSPDSPKIEEQPSEPAQIKCESPKLDHRSTFYEAPRSQEVADVFTEKDTRATLGRVWKSHAGKQIWDMILTAIDNGLCVRTERAFKNPTLGLLFPTGPSSFTRVYLLDNLKQRKHVRDVLLPQMIACKDQLLAEPERMREILSSHSATQQAKVQAEVRNQQRQQAIRTMAATEQELMMFGVPVWPRLDDRQGAYDYDQIRAAIWTFRDLLSWNKITNDNSPASIGIRMRLSMKWYNEYLIRTDPRRENPMRRIFSLLFWLSKLYEDAPEAECKWPHYPTAEAEW